MSGQRKGLTASFARLLLRLAEFPYTWVVGWRNRQFDRGPPFVQKVNVPVISVGNLTTGGTGKTPMVEWLARWFLEQGVKVALVSRGYGVESGAPNDEARELARKLPNVPHIQNRDRVAAAQRAIQQHAAEAIIMDDGFQHRRLHRDLDIVLIDALEPFGYGHLLPRGMLREPMVGLARAQVVALSRADLISENLKKEIRDKIGNYASDATMIEIAHAPTAVVSASGESAAVEVVREARIAAFCGIGNPAGFRQTLEKLGCNVVAWREFPDHHAFSDADIAELEQWSQNQDDVQFVLCTLKDLVKVSKDQLGTLPLRAVVVGTKFLAGESSLAERLAKLMAQRDKDENEKASP